MQLVSTYGASQFDPCKQIRFLVQVTPVKTRRFGEFQKKLDSSAANVVPGMGRWAWNQYRIFLLRTWCWSLQQYGGCYVLTVRCG